MKLEIQDNLKIIIKDNILESIEGNYFNIFKIDDLLIITEKNHTEETYNIENQDNFNFVELNGRFIDSITLKDNSYLKIEKTLSLSKLKLNIDLFDNSTIFIFHKLFEVMELNHLVLSNYSSQDILLSKIKLNNLECNIFKNGDIDLMDIEILNLFNENIQGLGEINKKNLIIKKESNETNNK